jgi:ribosomal protein L11 methyltransferase
MVARNDRTSRTYLKVVFQTPAAMADEAAGVLIAHGAMGCAVRATGKAIAKGARIVALEAFFDQVTADELACMDTALQSAGLAANGKTRPTISRIADPGWATLWMGRFRPLKVGRRFLIVAPWDKDCIPDERIKIVIQPAQAFGTGHHPTTYGVLRVLEDLCAARRFENALDVGTGSGILAFAMKLLGAADVSGIDTDRTALESARQNAALNGLARRVRFSAAPLASFSRRFDLITANILRRTLIDLAPKLRALLARDGRLVLGGILATEADEVARHYRHGLRCLHRRVARGWATLVIGR